MPDAQGRPFPGELVRFGIDPFLLGAPGSSPLTAAAIDAFNRNTRPLIENQLTLAGLGNSGALGVATADALAGALPQFILQDFDNRFKAAGVLQGEDQLNQSAAQLAANIANQEATRQIQAFGTAGNLVLGLGDPFTQAGAQQQQQQQTALQAFGAGGDIQQQTAQGALDAAQLERLRQQGLAEASTTGLFGGSVIPPSGLQTTNSRSSSGK